MNTGGVEVMQGPPGAWAEPAVGIQQSPVEVGSDQPGPRRRSHHERTGRTISKSPSEVVPRKVVKPVLASTRIEASFDGGA